MPRKSSLEKNVKERKKVNLALQGGGAHGAFTWGVLDELLRDGRIDIDGISATSAGTMNACALASGAQQGGTEGAQQALHDFWHNVSLAGKKANPVHKMPWEAFMPWNSDGALSYFMFDSITRVFSPYQLNPFDINPLRDIVETSMDFDSINRCDAVKLFISATHVHSGKSRVFDTNQITPDVVMASACLPFLFKAVSVEGEDYWDGGYVGNPALYPLFYKTDTRDLMIVHINPMKREETPQTAPEIMNRVNEISFNSSLLKELRAVAFVKKLLEHDMLKDNYKEHFTDVLVHSVSNDETMNDLTVASKFESDWGFLTSLRDHGRDTMKNWLERHFKDIGKRDTVDLHQEFLNSNTQIFEDIHDDTDS